MGEETEIMVEKMEKLTETLRLELREAKEDQRGLKISNMERIISDLGKTAQSLKAHVQEKNNSAWWFENRDVIEANKQYEYLRQYRNLPEISKRYGIHYCLYTSKDRFAFILEATKRCRADHGDGDGENNMLFRSIDENMFTLFVDEYLNFHKNNQMNDFLKETTKEDFGATVDPYVFALQEYVMLVCKPPPDWQPFNKASMKNINQIVRQVLEEIQNHGILPTEETDIQQSILLNKNRIHTHIKENFPIQLWSLAD